jgi:general secretion pathway protein K
MSVKLSKNQTGMSLIIVLWMLLVITAIALAYSRTVRTEVLLTSTYKNRAKAEGLAEAGIWRGAAMILNRAVAANNGKPVNLAGSIYSLETEVGELRVSLQSCNGLVDLNRAPLALIKSLLQRIVTSSETIDIIVDSLLDWRDENDLKRLHGAERDDYLAQRLGYGPKNGPMNSTHELARVKGVTPAIYDALKPLVTVYSGQPRIDINTAPYGVLAALPAIDSAVLNAIANKNNQIDLTQIAAETRKYIGAGQSEFFKISSFAKVNDSVTGITAVVKLAPTQFTPVTVIAWQHGVEPLFMDVNVNNE